MGYDFLIALFQLKVLAIVLLVFMIISTLARLRDVSKVSGIFIGLGLIFIAIWLTYDVQFNLQPLGNQFLHSSKNQITKEQEERFKEITTLFLWALTFVTGSLGTNVLSDAICRNFSYRMPWQAPRIICRFLQVLTRRNRKFKIRHTDERYILALKHLPRDIYELLLDFPQFCPGNTDYELVQMMDLTIVKIHVLAQQNVARGERLSILLKNELESISVDARRYIELQMRIAHNLDAESYLLKRRVRQLFERIDGVDNWNDHF